MRAGDVVDQRFELEYVAGQGGMGVVFRARDRSSSRVVAVKLLRRGASDLSVRLAREARVLSGLTHPRIVRYVAHGEAEGGDAYLALEWIEGEDLAHRLARGPLTIRESLTVVRAVAEALGFAHARSIVHRDVKPSNVFLAGGDPADARVLDFGLAQVHGARVITQSGAVVGTPGYIAPEQARGELDVDARADVFALGAVLFECLTGTPAFRGDHPMAILGKILFENAPRLAVVRPEAPRPLGDLVARMLAKDRAFRPADGDAVVREIDDLVRAAPPAPHVRLPPALTGAEQRILSVVVASADARAVAAAETLDYHGRSDVDEPALAAAARFGARLEHLLDGSIVAVLSAREVATDQAAAAARFALALRSALPDHRIGLATGRAVVSGHVPVGDAIERAAALTRVPSPDVEAHPRGRRPLRVDQVTAGLLDARFDVRGDERLLLLHGEREVVDVARTLLGRPAAFFGREREIDRLTGVFDRAVGDPGAKAALVKAGPGAGKSRLRAELCERLRARGSRFQLWIGQGDPLRAASPFGMIGAALRRSAGVLAGEPLAVQRSRLRARVARSVPAADLARVTEFLGELCGVASPDDESPRLRAAHRDPILMVDQVRRAFEDLLAAECREEPLLLVLEDLQWCDPPSVKLVAAALRALHDRPFMVLALARPEVQQVFPTLWEEHDLEELRLGPLPAAAAGQLVSAALGASVSPETRARIVERAAGNVFFLEELARAVAEGEGEALPETVLAMAQTRLDALSPGARRVLRAASVFGQVFWRRGVEALLGGEGLAADVGALLGELCDHELCARRGEGKFAGEDELELRHALLREVAYSTLTDADRTLGHALAGTWLEAGGGRDAAVLAEHFQRGGEAARAAACYARAAEQALAAGDFGAVIESAARGLASGAEGALAGELAFLRGEALHWSGRTAESEEWAVRALTLLPRAGARWWMAAGLAVTVYGHRSSTAPLEALADEVVALPADPSVHGSAVIALARAAVVLLFAGSYARVGPVLERMESLVAELPSPEPAVRARAFQARGIRALFAGDLEAAVRFHREAVAACDEAGDARASCAQATNLGDILRQLGLHEEAEAALRKSLATSLRLHLHGLVATAKMGLGMTLAALGQLDEGAVLAREAMELGHLHTLPRMEHIARAYFASILARAGDLEAAEEHVRAAIAGLAVIPPLRGHALAIGAQIALARGRSAEALERASQAMDLLRSLGNLEEGEVLVRLSYAEALAATGDREGAEVAARAAREHVLAQARKLVDPAVRQAFLGAVLENARTLALAEALSTS